MQLRVGGCYKDAHGRTYGPLKSRDSTDYPFLCPKTFQTFTAEGRMHKSFRHSHDLEEKVTPFVGTLPEIGAEVGDTVRFTRDTQGRERKILSTSPWEAHDQSPDSRLGWDAPYWEIVSKATPIMGNNPVQKVTTQQVVVGLHDKLKVCDVTKDSVTLQIEGTKFTNPELDNLIWQLQQIRAAQTY